MPSTLRIPFGKQHNRFVGIEEVMRGLACDCACPACDAPLVAKKGRRNVHHFAHYKGFDCAQALETSLHLMAKQILANNNSITLPAIYAHKQSKAIWLSRTLQYKHLSTEQYTDGMVPDSVVQVGQIKIDH